MVDFATASGWKRQLEKVSERQSLAVEIMPPICIHLSIAREAADMLHHPIIDQNLGSYLIGATFPDVHIIIADSQREQTHFFDMEGKASESGVATLFKEYPNLACSENLDSSTKSFVAGYLSHLVTDEVWILDIYRPCFGVSSPLSQDPMANILDRLLQFELDCQERADRAKLEGIRVLVCDWEPRVRLDLIDIAALKRWQGVVCTATTREPNLAFFPHFARRFLLPRHKINPEQLEQFLSLLPAKVEWAIRYVTPERLTSFREKAISQSAVVAKEYLGEDS